MFEITIDPRFQETDALGHINNTVIPVWFEQGRRDIFLLIHPAMTFHDWPLIIARLEVDFLAQTHMGAPVTIRTGVEKVGNSSFVLKQEAWQNGAITARGKAVMVYFDYKTNQSKPLPDGIRQKLQAVTDDQAPNNG